MRQLFALSILEFFLLTASAQYAARHNMSASTFLTENTKWKSQGYGLADLSAYQINGSATYAAIWNKTLSSDWILGYNLTEKWYQDTINSYSQMNYRPQRISCFDLGGAVYFNCIFFKTTSPWQARHNLTASQFQSEFNKWTSQGYRVVDVCGYSKNGTEMYAAVWEKSTGAAQVVRHAMSSAQFETEFKKQDSLGFKPVRITGFDIGGQDRYAAIWEKSNSRSYTRIFMDGSLYQTEFNNNSNRGATLVHIDGYNVAGQPRFAAIWVGGN